MLLWNICLPGTFPFRGIFWGGPASLNSFFFCVRQFNSIQSHYRIEWATSLKHHPRRTFTVTTKWCHEWCSLLYSLISLCSPSHRHERSISCPVNPTQLHPFNAVYQYRINQFHTRIFHTWYPLYVDVIPRPSVHPVANVRSSPLWLTDWLTDLVLSFIGHEREREREKEEFTPSRNVDMANETSIWHRKVKRNQYRWEHSYVTGGLTVPSTTSTINRCRIMPISIYNAIEWR